MDDVDPRGLEFPRLLIEDRRELPRQLLAALVVAVVEGVDHRHRARQRPLDRLIGLLAEELRVLDEHGLLAADGTDNGRHARVVAVADAHRLALLEIDTTEMLDERRDEVLAGLLPVADDVDAAVALLLDGDPQRILLALDQRVALQRPRRPQGLRPREPGRLRQAADDRGGKEGAHAEQSGQSSGCGLSGRGRVLGGPPLEHVPVRRHEVLLRVLRPA